MVRSQMQTAIKKFNAAISNGDIEVAKQLLPVTSSKIDNAAIKHVIHKNAANRKKAQIAKTLSQLEKGVIVVKVDAKTLKQAEQKAAAAKKAEEAAAIKAQRNEAKKAKLRNTHTRVYETGFLCVALAALELALHTRLGSNSEICLPLPHKCWD